MGSVDSKQTWENGVILTPLRQIYHPQGDIFHAMKASETDSFKEFGEAYFTTVYTGITKGWKKHTKMWMNLTVPVGTVKLFIYDEAIKETKSITFGENNYMRVTIPPGLWVAFRGVGIPLNLILNIASLEHDPTEAINEQLEAYPL